MFGSIEDPFGTNPDENFEIFLYDRSTDTLRQLTETDDGENQTPRISGDATVAYFYTTSTIFDVDPDVPVEMMKVDLSTGRISRAGAEGKTYLGCYSYGVAVDRTGESVVYSALHDELGTNLDFGAEVFLIDGRMRPRIRVSGAAPTTVSARPESGAIRYDFIRGNVANLGITGDVVDLGAVLCLEDDSPDCTGAGYEDQEDPNPGEAFFYVYRGAYGTKEPGTWGSSSDGFTREAGAGACNP